MNPLANHFAELKTLLQELESAVQQPREERFGRDQILALLPLVIGQFYVVIAQALVAQGERSASAEDAFRRAFEHGWLKGDLALWQRLISDSNDITTYGEHEDNAAEAVAQDVRACSYMLWETYQHLTARFRWQTQVRPVPAAVRALAQPNYVRSGI